MPLTKGVKTKDLYECKVSYLVNLFNACQYPWDMLPLLKEYLSSLIESGIEGFDKIMPGVLAGKDVKIHSTATLEGPTILGSGTELRPGAYVRGAVVTGAGCVLGNSSEFKNCILLDNVQAPHYNYVGDSILGNRVHLGAGTICSNLKADGKPVVIHGDTHYNTTLRKAGGFLGDGADIGCGCVLNPGTVIGRKTRVYPLNSLRGVFAEGCIVKSQDRVVPIDDKI